MTRKILVFSDGETWETIDEGHTPKILETSVEGFEEVWHNCVAPIDLDPKHIIHRYDVREE
jgi:hypothetical protein